MKEDLRREARVAMLEDNLYNRVGVYPLIMWPPTRLISISIYQNSPQIVPHFANSGKTKSSEMPCFRYFRGFSAGRVVQKKCRWVIEQQKSELL